MWAGEHGLVMGMQGMAQRNIVIKSFSDIPMADVEMIFPEKTVYIKPFVLIQLVVTVVLAIITIVTSLVQVISPSAPLHVYLYKLLHLSGSHM